jgi:nitronate monooxygenase
VEERYRADQTLQIACIDVPVIVAPMGFVTGPELAAAVSNAGGLGIMSFSGNPPAVLRQEIRRLRELTSKPFGVNLVLQFPMEEHFQVCLAEEVPVVSFFGVMSRLL